jgi:prepilin-type N-terminal cleavage/methylation domain-containing protein
MLFKPYKRLAFTLSELLISLSIIGLISAIAVPTIFNAVEANSKKSRFKEAFSILNNVIKKGAETSEMNHAGDFAYLQKNMNAGKFCSNAWDYGCWPLRNLYGEADASEPGFVLGTDVYVFGIENTGTPSADLYWVDANGANGPNTRCKDQFPLAVSVEDTPSYGGASNLQEGKVIMATNEKGFWWGCAAAEFPM